MKPYARWSKHIKVLGGFLEPVFCFSGLKLAKILKTGSRGLEKECVAISVGMSPLELWMHHVSMVSVANLQRLPYLYIWCQSGLGRWHDQSSNWHIL